MKRRDFLKYIGCGCCGYTLSSCSTAPITGRNQVTFFPESTINSQAATAYANFKKKAKLSKDIDTLNLIETIGSKMQMAISAYFKSKKIKDPTKDFNWCCCPYSYWNNDLFDCFDYEYLSFFDTRGY